jgi:hypothetical protein
MPVIIVEQLTPVHSVFLFLDPLAQFIIDIDNGVIEPFCQHGESHQVGLDDESAYS